MKQPKAESLNLSAILNEFDASKFDTSANKMPVQHAIEPPENDTDKPALDQNIQRHIGRKLKASYEELIKQPVPDKFRNLLDQLQRQEKKQ